MLSCFGRGFRAVCPSLRRRGGWRPPARELAKETHYAPAEAHCAQNAGGRHSACTNARARTPTG